MTDLYFKKFIRMLAEEGNDKKGTIAVTMTFIEHGLISKQDAEAILAEYDIYIMLKCNHCSIDVMPIFYEDNLYCSGTCETCASGAEKCPACRKKPETKK